LHISAAVNSNPQHVAVSFGNCVFASYHKFTTTAEIVDWPNKKMCELSFSNWDLGTNKGFALHLPSHIV
jgi:hypothetical protein